ncbi:MAG: hypothetical protein QF719_01245 [Chloroflexota bacterium]|jgi:hypothetical protein|nr:hypothetical protein [Chloroflexota bacterium]
MPRSIALILPALIVFLLAACGDSEIRVEIAGATPSPAPTATLEPTPTPTETPTPTPTETPTLTPTLTPTEIPTLAFSADEFQRQVIDTPPGGISVSLGGALASEIPGVESADIEVTLNVSPPMMKLSLNLVGATSLTLDIIATEDSSYVGVGGVWMKSSASEDLADLASEFGGDLGPDDLIEGTWEYIGEVPCGEDACWQVESSDGALMNLLKGDYTPVSVTTVADGAEIVLDIHHWGNAVDIEIPVDAREVSEEEMMFALLGAFMPLIGTGL